MDPEVPVHHGESIKYDWTKFCPGVSEELPYDMPLPNGKPVSTSTYEDADHAGDHISRRSVTGVLLFINSNPIQWYCKRQNTVETSTYGFELVSALIGTELSMALRYKLHMLGVPIQGPTIMYGDNQSVVINASNPSSTLDKKHNALAYHRTREAIAAGIIDFRFVRSEDNFADILTKALSPRNFQILVKPLLMTWKKEPK